MTKGELHDTHNPIPEPKTTAGAAYRVILIVTAVAALFGIGSLRASLSGLQNTVNSMKSHQQQLTHEICELRSQLDYGSRRVSGISWEYLGIDTAARTADIRVEVTLQSYRPDTAVTLVLNGSEFPLEPDSAGTYRRDLTAGLFAENAPARILVTEDGTTVSKDADLPDALFREVLPTVSLGCSLSSGYSFGKLKYEGSYTVYTSHTDDIESASATYISHGRDLKTLDITDAVLNEEEITLDGKLTLDRDLTVRIELMTKSGFRIAEQTVLIYDASAEPDSAEGTEVYDLDGNLLWGEHY